MAEANYFVLQVIRIVVLGIAQGSGLFSPIPLQSRLSFLQKLIGIDILASANPYVLFFLQMGTVFSVIFVFRKRISEILLAMRLVFMKIFRGEFVWVQARTDQKIALSVIVSILPSIAVSLIFSFLYGEKEKPELFWSIFFILSAVIYFFSDREKNSSRHTYKLSVMNAFFAWLGCIVGIVPGVSSPCVSATVCIRNHFKRTFCVEYAFFLSVPLFLADAIVSLIRGIVQNADIADIPYGLFGMVISFGIGLVFVTIIKKLVEKRKMYIFAAISVIFGLASLVLSVV